MAAVWVRGVCNRCSTLLGVVVVQHLPRGRAEMSIPRQGQTRVNAVPVTVSREGSRGGCRSC
eukprot:2742879-Rhodomonas_salina.1